MNNSSSPFDKSCLSCFSFLFRYKENNIDNNQSGQLDSLEASMGFGLVDNSSVKKIDITNFISKDSEGNKIFDDSGNFVFDTQNQDYQEFAEEKSGNKTFGGSFSIKEDDDSEINVIDNNIPDLQVMDVDIADLQVIDEEIPDLQVMNEISEDEISHPVNSVSINLDEKFENTQYQYSLKSSLTFGNFEYKSDVDTSQLSNEEKSRIENLFREFESNNESSSDTNYNSEYRAPIVNKRRIADVIDKLEEYKNLNDRTSDHYSDHEVRRGIGDVVRNRIKDLRNKELMEKITNSWHKVFSGFDWNKYDQFFNYLEYQILKEKLDLVDKYNATKLSFDEYKKSSENKDGGEQNRREQFYDEMVSFLINLKFNKNDNILMQEIHDNILNYCEKELTNRRSPLPKLRNLSRINALQLAVKREVDSEREMII